MSEDLKPYIEQFQETWINRLLYGTTSRHVVNADYLIFDGRKRPKIWRELIAAGYVTDEGVLTDAAFKELAIQRPHLILLLPSEKYTKRDTNFWEKYPGILFNQLTLPQKKHVVTAPEQYEFFGFDSNWPRQGTKPRAFGEPYSDRNHREALWISDEEFRTHREDTMYWLEFHRLKAKNLPWAMTAFDIVSEGDKDCFEQTSDTPFGMNGYADYFGHDPAKWEEDLDTQLARCQAQLDAYARKQRVLLVAKAKIEATGGWGAFHTKIDQKIHAHLKEAREKKDQTDSSEE